MGEACLNAAVGYDKQGRYVVYAEACCDVGALSYLDFVKDERPVVLASLQHLRDEALGTTRAAVSLRVEEDQPWLRLCRPGGLTALLKWFARRFSPGRTSD